MSCALITREKQEDPVGKTVHFQHWFCLKTPLGWQKSLISAFVKVEDALTQKSSVDPPIQKWLGYSFYSLSVHFANIHLRKKNMIPLEDVSLVHWIGKDIDVQQHLYSFAKERKRIGVLTKFSCKKDIKTFFILSKIQHPKNSTISPSLTT